MHECAISRSPIFLGSIPVFEGGDNGPRRPSGATATSSGRKYRKISVVGFRNRFRCFLQRFPPGKVKTSVFSETKFRCFAPKVRMFMAKKSDVFGGKSRLFRLFCRIF